MSLLPAFYLDAVASLEVEREEEGFQAVGSGVLVGRRVAEDVAAPLEDAHFWVYLVTNYHVLEDEERLYASLNVEGKASQFSLDSPTMRGTSSGTDQRIWTWRQPSFARESLRTPRLKSHGSPRTGGFFSDEMIDAGVGPGDEIFVCGFPMGLTGRERKYSIVRGGIVARLDEELINDTGSYLVDCTIFPGNSGGPVLLKPTIEFDPEQQTLTHDVPDLIGIVRSYIPYEDVSVSLQTLNPRTTFEENSGWPPSFPWRS
jgi:S1-C subfamily serine protease